MTDLFDSLIREGRDTDAVRLMAREYYEKGRMGHTRLRLLVRVADELDEANARLDALGQRKEADVVRVDNAVFDKKTGKLLYFWDDKDSIREDVHEQ